MHPFTRAKPVVMAKYGYLEAFMNDLRSSGRYAFSLSELRNKFDQSDEAIKKALQRLKNKGELAAIRKEFYVVISPEYRSKGILPPSLFIDALMKFLEKKYYVGLLNAAAYHGAAHQQPQSFSVIIGKPGLRDIHNDKLKLNFYLKKEWQTDFIIQKKVDTGYINISSPELTAIDLVYYFEHVGGMNRVVTVLDELCESMDADKLLALVKVYAPKSAVQRLGFLLEQILQKRNLSDPIKRYLKTVNIYPILLKPQSERQEMISGNAWKVVQNLEIETDL